MAPPLSAGRTGPPNFGFPSTNGTLRNDCGYSIETFRPKAGAIRFQVLADGIAVFDGSAPLGKWEKTFDLSSNKFSDKVMIELRSETFVPKGVMDKGKNTDTRMLGVQVKGVMLQRDAKG